MTKVAILGAGRMGKEIIKMAVEQGLDVVAVFDKEDSLVGKDAGTLSGVGELKVSVNPPEDMEDILSKNKPDVAIDFTSADACVNNSKTICENRINMVIGTTGFSESQYKELKENIEKNKAGAVISPNMSVGVNVFWNIVKEATKKLKDHDIEIIEKHHRFKKDAPSGTAFKTAELICKELGKDLGAVAVYGRQGMSERKKGEIGIHAIRSGDIVGEHNVLYGTLGERIEISHTAHKRAAFVSGVIRAVEFIKGKKGIFDMGDVLGLN